MATELTVYSTNRTSNGLNLSDNDVAADAAGNYWTNTGSEMLYCLNSSGSPITLTVVTQQTVDTLAVTDLTVTLSAGEAQIVGPFPTSIYNDSSGYCQVTYSGVTTLTVLAFKPTVS